MVPVHQWAGVRRSCSKRSCDKLALEGEQSAAGRELSFTAGMKVIPAKPPQDPAGGDDGLGRCWPGHVQIGKLLQYIGVI